MLLSIDDMDGPGGFKSKRRKTPLPYWPFPESKDDRYGVNVKTVYCTADYTEGLRKAYEFTVDRGWRTYAVSSSFR